MVVHMWDPRFRRTNSFRIILAIHLYRAKDYPVFEVLMCLIHFLLLFALYSTIPKAWMDGFESELTAGRPSLC